MDYSTALDGGSILEFSKPGKKFSLSRNPLQPRETIVTKTAHQAGGKQGVSFRSIDSKGTDETIDKLLKAGYSSPFGAESSTSGGAKKPAKKAKSKSKSGAKSSSAKKTSSSSTKPAKSVGSKSKGSAPKAEMAMPASTPVTPGNVEKAIERFGSTRLKTKTSKNGEYRVVEIYGSGKAKIFDVKIVDADPALYKGLAKEGFVFDPSYGEWLGHINNHLARAVRENNLADIGKLLENGGNASGTVHDADGAPLSSLIHTAVRNQNADVIRLLLSNGADINDQNSRNRRSPLMYAVIFGGKDNKTDIARTTNIIKLLLEKGADPKLKDDKGKTALDYASNVAYFQKVNEFEQAIKNFRV